MCARSRIRFHHQDSKVTDFSAGLSVPTLLRLLDVPGQQVQIPAQQAANEPKPDSEQQTQHQVELCEQPEQQNHNPYHPQKAINMIRRPRPLRLFFVGSERVTLR